MTKAIELVNIRKEFPGVLALDQMSFDVCPGEVHAICGENGAGKSTLMKVITAVHLPDKGDIIVQGEKQNFKTPDDSLKKGISIIYQETSLFSEMSVMENLFIGHELQKTSLGILKTLNYKEMYRVAAELIEELGFNIRPEDLVKDLGMAQKQMVEIAKALSIHAKVLILDEPTASLTNKEVSALFLIINKLKAQGVAIIYISHRLEEIFELCDRVTVIRDGRYISTNVVAQTTKECLIADMVGRTMINLLPKEDVVIGQELIRVTGLSQDNLLHNIDFHINHGEIVGFAGLAGAGRTELAQAICGLSGPIQGEILLRGESIINKDYRQAITRGMVYISEDRAKYGLVTKMSVKDNITLPQLSHFTKKGFVNTKSETAVAEDYIKKLEIKTPNGDFLTENLSGGNQQKVCVAKALALKPELLILDEPTRGVDIGAKAEIHKVISQMVKRGLTLMLISSELHELIGLCDRIYVLNQGQIKGCISREDATQESILTMALSN